MGRRRRRVIKVVKRRLPDVFECPKCGEISIKVNISKGDGVATVQCGSCGLKERVEVPPIFEAVDAYCRFVDEFYQKIETKV